MKPVGTREIELLQSIIGTTRRLAKVPSCEGSLAFTAFRDCTRNLLAEYPRASLEYIETRAQAEAQRADSDEIEKLGRYETRHRRSLESLYKEHDRIQSRRVPGEFKLIPVAARLVEARKELQRKSREIEDPLETQVESASSKQNLNRKIVFRSLSL